MSEPFDAAAAKHRVDASYWGVGDTQQRFHQVLWDLDAALTALAASEAAREGLRDALIWQMQHCTVCHGQGCNGCERARAALAAARERDA